ncbi:hypothetical protein LLT3_06050 [Lactococcus cremoris subsp. cremoris TIFN3]|uniref:Uncharacterized protein n=1 Tax=Lactococcus cremoris subsp. cremoris TIFN3 TaxID=1234873 RepID=T0VGP7_LACLC|nr:hypothetical protein LLT3_06050 [Lactococcus cremoris subsp. cremoris TIFN3]
MSEVEQSFDSQRNKIVEYLEQEGKGNKDVIWAYENIKLGQHVDFYLAYSLLSIIF